MFLKCFSLVDDKVAKGVDADQFDCINIESPSATQMNKAVLEFIPLFPCAGTDTSEIAAKSLTFLHEPSKGDKEDSTGVILAFDPNEWRLCYNANLYTLIDPCGINGHVLIMANKGAKHVLANTNNRNCVLSITEENIPVVENCRRAAVLYGAVKARLLVKSLSKSGGPALPASSRKRARSARS